VAAPVRLQSFFDHSGGLLTYVSLFAGSYFVKNRFGETLAVFKPRDEGPFAPLNPKWPKFFQVRVVAACER